MQLDAVASEKILDVRDLTKSYDGSKAVDALNFAIDKGQCFALLGPNGAGKTTTCEMLEGLISPDQGQISIFGKSLAKERDAIIKDVGVQLQETTLYQKYTVEETLTLFASFYDQSEPVDSVIRLLGLEEKAKVRLEKLSGGQRQRVHLGCALINNPKLIFLDEPTTGLDPAARRNIWQILENLKSDGRALLLTTHYMEEAETLADIVAIMDRGQIIAQDTPQALVQKYCGEQVLWFEIKNKDDEEAQLNRLKEKASWLSACKKVQDGYEAVCQDGSAQLQQLIIDANALNIAIDKISLRTATLEDVFLQLTGRSFQDA